MGAGSLCVGIEVSGFSVTLESYGANCIVLFFYWLIPMLHASLQPCYCQKSFASLNIHVRRLTIIPRTEASVLLGRIQHYSKRNLFANEGIIWRRYQI